MKKTFILLLVLCLIPLLLQAVDVGKWNGINTYDVTAPTVSSASIGTNGTTVTVNFSEEVITSGYANGDLILACTGSSTRDVNLNTIAGTLKTRTFTAAATIYSTDTCTLKSGAGIDITDVVPITIAAFTGQAVTNSSSQTSGYATPAVVQSNSGYSGGPATLGSNTTTGNTVAVWVSGNGIASFTCSGGGVTSWYYTTTYNGSSSTLGAWCYGYVTSGTTASITLGGTLGDPGWSIYEISGVASGDAKDREAGLGDAALFDGAWTSGQTATTTQTHAALLGAWASENGLPGITWAGGWGSTTIIDTHYHGTAFRAVTSTGQYEASGTNTSNGEGIAVILVLKASSL